MGRADDVKGKRLRREADQRHQREKAKIEIEKAKVTQATHFHVADLRYGTLKVAIIVIAVILIAYFVSISIGHIAGKTTNFNAVANGILNLSVNEWVAYSIAAATGVGWYTSSRTRRRMEKQHELTLGELQKQIGAGRARKDELDA